MTNSGLPSNTLLVHAELTLKDWNGFAINEKALFVVLVPIRKLGGKY